MSEAVDSYLSHLGLEVGDELKHYGKKGMKWGVRKDDGGVGSGSSGSSDRSEARKAKNAEIVNARERQQRGAVELDIQRARILQSSGIKEAKATFDTYREMKKEHLSSPDAAMAKKLTSGEKILKGINTGVTVAAIAYAVANRDEFAKYLKA